MYFEGFRAEEFVYQKLDKPKPPRLTESEALGQSNASLSVRRGGRIRPVYD